MGGLFDGGAYSRGGLIRGFMVSSLESRDLLHTLSYSPEL